ncbi:hypothetical protein [Amycolatopsis sp. NPDC059657]|uniref:PheS-related mystery ligase SrmL n=1 Tax=Amycolatopsis sp. NPDC059657 TaxID=3346899 RepID=UPI00366FF1B6
MSPSLTPEQLSRDLAVRDLTDPAEGPHAIQLVLERAVTALTALWDCEVRWCRGPRVVTIEDNYDNLGYAGEDVTRDARYTRYVDGHRMLRSHSSALIPSALRQLSTHPADDVLLVCPGIVYRRDSVDRLHTGTPHQLDLWRLRRGTLTEHDLDAMITALLKALVPGASDLRSPRVHPYTTSGLQVDADGIEILECGLAHPAVLARAGLDESWNGLAMGMGLDRILMLLKDIPDIRLLRSPGQMTDLAPYHPVSPMPAIRRDVSIAVDADDLAEDLGDRVRTALGDDADCVESVEILSETPCSALPPQALERLGARPGQKNVLVKIVLRHLARTLSDPEANALRDRVYAALHQGSREHTCRSKPN